MNQSMNQYNNPNIGNSNQNNVNNSNNSSQPIRVKLTNLGDTSYLNSVLYLLGNIKSFMFYFLKQENIKQITANIKYQPLCFVLYRLFLHFYNKNNEQEYKPDALMEVLGALNIVYKSRSRRNPNELLSFILDNLHSELNEKKDNNNIIQNSNLNNKEEVILNGFANFKNSNASLISTLFNWFEIKESKSQQCNNIIYNFYTFNTFELDILGTYIFKNNQSNYKKPITLNECIQYQQSSNNQSKLFCNHCKLYHFFQNNSKIFSSPYMFIFSLNRGNIDNNLLSIPFIIEEKIDLTFFVENQQSCKNYELNGIVSFKSDNPQIVSFCKSPLDNNWYCYSEEFIGQVQLNQVLMQHNNNMYIPSILLYKYSK